MALGKLTFLCLNALCIGSVAVLVLGALMQWYGGRLSEKPHADAHQVTGHARNKRRERMPGFRTVDADFYQIGAGRKERRRARQDSEREVLYEYDG